MPNVFVPAWYLRNGRINAAESTLENASSSCERWGIFCAALVVVAVTAELVIAFAEPPYNVFLKLSAPTDAAVAIGIVGEVLFGMWDGRIQTELRKRSNDKLGAAEKAAGEANERAAEANQKAEEERAARLRLAAQLSARTLSDADALKIVEALKGKISSRLTVVRPSDTEASFFAMELAKAFKSAEIDTAEILLPLPGDGYGHSAGMYAMADPKVPGQYDEMMALANVLGALNIGPVIPGRGVLYGPKGLPRLPEDIPFPWLYVGLKWPTSFDSGGAARSVGGRRKLP